MGEKPKPAATAAPSNKTIKRDPVLLECKLRSNFPSNSAADGGPVCPLCQYELDTQLLGN